MLTALPIVIRMKKDVRSLPIIIYSQNVANGGKLIIRHAILIGVSVRIKCSYTRHHSFI